jgi:hypothetical protein
MNDLECRHRALVNVEICVESAFVMHVWEMWQERRGFGTPPSQIFSGSGAPALVG